MHHLAKRKLLETSYKVYAGVCPGHRWADLRYFAHCATRGRKARAAGIKGEARNALLTFQVLQHQRQVALSHKADLLASLASMRNGEATTIQDVGENPWQSECDLFVLADPSGKIIALHSKMAKFPLDVAQDMISHDLKQGHSTG